MNVLSKDKNYVICRFNSEEMDILHNAMILAREEFCVKKGEDNGLFEKYRKYSSIINVFEPKKEEKKDILSKNGQERLDYLKQKKQFFSDCIKSLLEKEGKKND